MALTQPNRPKSEYVIEVLDNVAEASGLTPDHLEVAVMAVLEHVAWTLERDPLSISADGLRDAVDTHRAPAVGQMTLFDL